jgi:hypothetical protein
LRGLDIGDTVDSKHPRLTFVRRQLLAPTAFLLLLYLPGFSRRSAAATPRASPSVRIFAFGPGKNQTLSALTGVN